MRISSLTARVSRCFRWQVRLCRSCYKVHHQKGTASTNAGPHDLVADTAPAAGVAGLRMIPGMYAGPSPMLTQCSGEPHPLGVNALSLTSDDQACLGRF